MYDVGRCLLSDILLQKRMTQQELADKISVTRQQINSYCKSENIMTLPIAKNIAHILNLECTDCLYEWLRVEERTKRR